MKKSSYKNYILSDGQFSGLWCPSQELLQYALSEDYQFCYKNMTL